MNIFALIFFFMNSSVISFEFRWDLLFKKTEDRLPSYEEIKSKYEMKYKKLKKKIQDKTTPFINDISNLATQSAFNALSYVDVPVNWFSSISKVFPGNMSDFIFIHHISHPLDLSTLKRISKVYYSLCQLNLCYKYKLLYNNLITSASLNKLETDRAILSDFLPEESLYFVDSFPLNQNYSDLLEAELKFSYWLSKYDKIKSGYVWVMRDDVGYVGDFAQILTMLQLSSTADYLAIGCTICKNFGYRISISSDYYTKDHAYHNNSSSIHCHTNFVRYSSSFLKSVNRKIFNNDDKYQYDKDSFSIIFCLNNKFKYLDMLEISNQIFHPYFWKITDDVAVNKTTPCSNLTLLSNSNGINSDEMEILENHYLSKASKNFL